MPSFAKRWLHTAINPYLYPITINLNQNPHILRTAIKPSPIPSYNSHNYQPALTPFALHAIINCSLSMSFLPHVTRGKTKNPSPCLDPVQANTWMSWLLEETRINLLVDIPSFKMLMFESNSNTWKVLKMKRKWFLISTEKLHPLSFVNFGSKTDWRTNVFQVLRNS